MVILQDMHKEKVLEVVVFQMVHHVVKVLLVAVVMALMVM